MPQSEKTIYSIYQRLVGNPWFPMLFISEAIKEAVVVLTDIAPVLAYAILAVVAVVIWALSDKVDIEVSHDTEASFWK